MRERGGTEDEQGGDALKIAANGARSKVGRAAKGNVNECVVN